MKAYNADVFDNGLNRIKNACTKIIVTDGVPNINDYAATLALKCAEVDVASGDFTLANNGAARKVSHAAQEGVATATTNGANDLHIAYLNVSGTKVLAITDETSNQPLTTGNPVVFPALELKFNAPT